MSDADYIAAEVWANAERELRCSVHGEMRFRFAGDWWVCPGWDGEGCCAVAAELVADYIARHAEAETADSPVLVAVPVEGSRPSQWGFRPAILRQPEPIP